jgi:RimJ/RimL family protein N-acetyltransferase
MFTVHKVTDPAEFLNKSFKYLHEYGIETNIIIHYAIRSLDSQGPISGGFYIVYDNANIVGVAMQCPASAPFYLPKLPTGAATAIARLFDHEFTEANGDLETIKEFTNNKIEFSKLDKDVTYIIYPSGLFNVELNGSLVHAGEVNLQDAAEAAEMLVEFQNDANIPVALRPNPSVEDVLTHLKKGNLILWKGENQIVGIAGATRSISLDAYLANNPSLLSTDAVAHLKNCPYRIGPVFVKKDYRNKGIGASMTFALTKKCFEEGATSVMLFAAADNAGSNRAYQKVGYKLVPSVAKYAIH